MQPLLSHIQFNVEPANLAFYKDLLTFLGWSVIYADDEMLGLAGKGETSLWFVTQANATHHDYDGLGMNHLGLGAAAQGDVDSAADYLKQQGVELLFETPRHRPEFSQSAEHTYYQIMFESPDHILFEVVYTGLKAA
ncbi:MAG: VOC family protein [Herpetosiphonaceae bacterium]|nr:VOC family protein [Herpetosiphonaceae bacterium]